MVDFHYMANWTMLGCGHLMDKCNMRCIASLSPNLLDKDYVHIYSFLITFNPVDYK